MLPQARKPASPQARKPASPRGSAEQFLKLQNDALRPQSTTLTGALRARNASQRESVDQLLIENDQY
jgi:hypothetical protein